MNLKKESNLQTKPHKSEVDNQLEELLSAMPEALKAQLVNMLDSPEYANQNQKTDFLVSLQSFDMLTQKDSAVRPSLPEGTDEESLAKALSKVDDSQSILETEQLEGAEIFTSLFESIAAEPCDDINEIRRFANASNLHEAFGEEASEALTFLNAIPQDCAELIHGAIACQMAGMPKQAKLLFQMFAQRQFVDANDGYQSLQTEITKQKGQFEKQKYVSKKGGFKRQLPARKTKEQAIELFLAGQYKNYSAAASELFPQIKEIAANHGFTFNSDINGLRTVTDWFRSTKLYN